MPQKQKAPLGFAGRIFLCKTGRPAEVLTQVQTLLLTKPVKIFAADKG